MTLAHDVVGSGPAVLLLHSAVGDRRMWDPIPGHEAIRCDFRGFGSSPAATGPYRDADDVIELLDHLGAGRLALVGSSYGGTVALEVAARWPDRVSALLLLCSGRLGHVFSAALRDFGAQEDELLAAGDIAGAVELNVRMWLGPSATDAARDRVRQMQRHAFDVQLAAPDFPPPPVDSRGPATSRTWSAPPR